MGQNIAQGEEPIEGYRGEDEKDSSWGDYPIDTLLIRNEPRTVHEVLRRIKQGAYVMDPDFQRDFVWDAKKQSKLIESVLLRIPLPVFYIAENPQGKMVVVDGLQRLTTFLHFCDNEFSLNLPDRRDLNKKYFTDLPPKLQNRIEDCNLILYIIDSKVPPTALLDIFERVNSGAPLTRQQMRNCLNSGPATRFLKEEAQADLFKQATGYSLTPLKMLDREMINRFCGFQVLGLAAYWGQMDFFLARTLEEMNSQASEEFFENLRVKLRRSLINNLQTFGHHAFRKQIRGRDARTVFNASIWDTMSFHMAELDETWVTNNAEAINSAFLNLLDDPVFRDSITLGTNQQNRVQVRFRMVKEMFDRLIMNEILG